MRSIRIAALFLIATMIGFVGKASADNLTWYMKSEHPNIVQLEFYSQDRDAAWPGGDEAYDIDDYAVHTYSLECQTGEKICYGAWVKGDSTLYWGSGLHGAETCDDCCGTCGRGDMQTITLKR